jgi:acyl-coenzyme A synthetase/AMP-(fatty) acid ligase
VTPRDQIETVAGASLADSSAYPIVGHIDEDGIVAYQDGRPIPVARFLHDVAALAARLPAQRYALNLCMDRYRFAVGLAAALCRRQISLLPPNDTPGVLKALAADYPDLYCLVDTARPPLPSLVYPADLGDGSAREVPIVPAQRPALVLFTSGSTGRPKPTAKSWGTLVRSAQAAGRRLEVGRLRGATLIGTVPHQHSYGLESTVLLGLQHGLAIDTRRPFYPGDIRARIAAAPRPRILVTTPVHIRALLAEPEHLPPLDLIVLATAPLTAALAIEAEARFGAPLMEIYGCTEAGQVATRRTARDEDWLCLDGVALEPDDHGPWVSGPCVETRTPLHDVIERSGPASFRLRGRVVDLVDVAGKHTSLAHLNHQLLSIDGVKDGVFVMPEESDERIARPMAFVVAPGLEADAILRALRERVDAAFLPRPLVFVDALPRNALGKLTRDALLRLAAQSRCS